MTSLIVVAVCTVALFAPSIFAQTLSPMQAPGLLGIGPPPVSAAPGDTSRASDEQMKATGLKDCKVGDRVLAKYEERWISAQVIAVDPAALNTCTVHFIGRPPTADGSVPAWKLRAEDARP